MSKDAVCLVHPTCGPTQASGRPAAPYQCYSLPVLVLCFKMAAPAMWGYLLIKESYCQVLVLSL